MQLKTFKRPFIYYTASFVLPFIVIMAALAGLQIVPFGEHTLLISDAKALYINYLSYAGRMVKGLEGITYSFEKGLGGNMMPHIGGTISNPLFYLIALFRISDYPIAYTLISTLNFCVCGLTMYILLADLFGHRRSNLVFSTSYALSGFLTANVFQVIFFTGCQALPLMVLGLRKLFQGKNPLLYILSIAYAMATSFYFGFTLCVASVLFFFAMLWLKKDDLQGRKLSVFVNYAISSLCGGLLSIPIWLPAFMGIQGGRADQTKITDFSFAEKMPFLEIFTKLFTGSNSTSQLVNGLPNIFVGLLPVLLVILFFMNSKISGRMKAAAGLVLGFYLLGFYVIAFDMLLHGGTTTNWFNFRYSYIFSFVLLVIAAWEWQYADELSPRDLKYAFIGLVLAALVIFSKKYEYVMGSVVLLDLWLLLVMYLAYRMYQKDPVRNPKRTFEAVVLFVVCISLYLNYTISTKNILEWELKDKDYLQTVDAVEPLTTAIQDADDDFYRMEVTHQLSGTCGNDPMLYGYHGVGHGGSNERNFVRQELFKLGVQWFDMRNYYSQGIPAATDTLLGLRYLIADEDMTEEKGYQRITDMRQMGLDFGDAVIYDAFKNPNALPIAFVSQTDINGLTLTDEDLFDNLNRVWKAISGEDRAVFTEENEITFRSVNLSDAMEMEADEARELTRKYDEQAKVEAASNEAAEGQVGETAEAYAAADGTGNDAAGAGGNVTDNTAGNAAAENTGAVAAEGTADADATVNDFHIIMDEQPMFASSVEFSFTAAQDGPVYVYHRGAMISGSGNAESLVKYMGYYHKGDTVKGYLAVQGDYVNRVTFEEYAGRFRAAYVNPGVLEELSGIVNARPSAIEKEKDSHLKGTVTLEEGQELLFTIPWDEGWTCYVDGQKTELTKVLGVFMAAEAQPGEHTYEMIFEPRGLRLGAMVSIGALLLLILYLLFGRKLIVRTLEKKHDTIAEEAMPAGSAETAETDMPASTAEVKETDQEAEPGEAAASDEPPKEAIKDDSV